MVFPDHAPGRQIAELQQRIAQLERQLDRARSELAALENTVPQPDSLLTETLHASPTGYLAINRHSSAEDKVRLFRSRFRGRTDAFATSWTSSRTGKKGWSPKTRHWVRPQEVTKADLLPLTDDMIVQHLKPSNDPVEPFHVGLYPLLDDEHCYLLACDFDKGAWQDDAAAYSAAAHRAGFDSLVEVSRSGRGAHVWIFFADKVPAVQARALGAHLLRDAMSERTGLPLESYDRLFPSQDTLPTRSSGANRLGNLIALPLEGTARTQGRTVFVDRSTFAPLPDYFAALDQVVPASAQDVASFLRAQGEDQVGPQVTLYEPGPRQRRGALKGVVDKVPLELVRDARLRIPLPFLPSAVPTELKHLACQANPEFYRRQSQRMSTYGFPRLVQCFTQTSEELLLPRGVTDEAARLLGTAGFKVKVSYPPRPATTLGLTFQGELRATQREAFKAIVGHHEGVVVAPTGSGKTVIACALIAERDVPAAILVNNTQLLGQWRQSLQSFLGLEAEMIGQLGDGKHDLTGHVDLVMVQSLRARGAGLETLQGYGQIIVDECHSVAAPSTLSAVEQIEACYWVGLTATPYRADELNGLITMQCGPIRYELDTPLAAVRELHVHRTTFSPETQDTDGAGMQELYNEIAVDEERNRQIADLVASEVREGRHCLVLSNRTAHIRNLAELIEQSGTRLPVLQLHGKLSKKEREAASAQLAQVDSEGGAYVVVASDKIAGEGFNLPSLDTLFMVSPVSFKGKIEQLIGRIQRTDDAERTIRIHDFVDVEVAVFAYMARRRHRVISKKGFALMPASGTYSQPTLT